MIDENGTLDGIDYVARIETLGRDWPTICNHLGVDAELPHANKSRERFIDREPTWDAETRAVVNEYFQRDFDLFDHPVYP